ncbi:E3 ubiquitin-protein ligase RNF135 isoform X2 [Dromiciops gliroides]|uniref:E3 ubiquitin-protein ligase RNF135 isoform X2 n=1 Tax=Dromiciops gliroides TaxID=33562 RepID=UPI001CC7DC9D|nr:E3 ubiquitin-protein ligase RNF135 isoform X2 [Dromiciops gliroides]
MAGWGLDSSASRVPVWLCEDDLSCGICQTLFSCPTTLPCGHSFCHYCIELHWTQTGRPRGGAARNGGPGAPGAKGRGGLCPFCREEVCMSPWLKKNTTLQYLVDKYTEALKEECEPRDPSPSHLPALQEPTLTKGRIHEVRQELEGLLEQLISGVSRLQCLGPLEESRMSEDLITQEKNPNIFQKNINEILSDIKELKKKFQEKLIWEEAPSKITNGESLETSPCSSSRQPAQIQPGPKKSCQLVMCSILPTFDQRTAYHYLELSKNNKKVTVSPYRQFYSESRGRFQNSQVLCCQGFSSGQQYWEVNTRYCSGWATGVAAKDIITHSQRLGRTADSWCMEWSEDSAELCSWHEGRKRVISKERPMMVGIWLDLEGNQLSFYSVENEEKFLYRFELPVPMPVVFPAFWLFGLQPGNSLIINEVRPN